MIQSRPILWFSRLLTLFIGFLACSTFKIQAQGTPLFGVINNYAKVNKVFYCTKSVDVANTLGFNAGQKVLLIQMQGAIIDTTNTASFGTITNYENAGNAEVLEIEKINGLTIEFKHAPMLNYSPEYAPVQLVTLPSYDTASISMSTGNLTCQPWNGSTGGVLAFDVNWALNISGIIDISDRGFFGGIARNDGTGAQKVHGYVFPRNRLDSAAEKGEGISVMTSAYANGRGAPANGGGGGNGHNAGGGGGGNGGAGGIGSFDWPDGALHNGGVGGYAIDYQRFVDSGKPRIMMGGGGGTGHVNNNAGSDGGKGGAIAFIRANNVVIRPGAVIFANGQNVTKVGGNDGCGAGGAGGSILFDVNRFISFGDKLRVEAHGGFGGQLTFANHGPGGGGGGGAVFFLQSIDTNVITDIRGGAPGYQQGSFNTYGCDYGKQGVVIGNVKLSESKKTVTMVDAGNDTSICEKTTVLLQAKPINGRGPFTYEWQGQNITDPTKQITDARPGSTTTYTVLITDSVGCVNYDKITVTVLPAPSLNMPLHTILKCKGDTISLNATSSQNVTWLPNKGLLENTGNVVRCIIDSSITYTIQAETTSGCFAVDTIRVEVMRGPTVTNLQRNSSMCKGADSMLIPNTFFFGGSSPYKVTWSHPTLGTIRTDSLFQQIPVQPDTTTTYCFTIVDQAGCSFKDSITVTVLPVPEITAINDTLICKGSTVQLWANGADSYDWTPSTGLSNPNIANPIANPTTNTVYTVKGTNSFGCSSIKTVSIIVSDPPLKPSIQQIDDTLKVSGSAFKHEWFCNNQLLNNAQDSLFVINQTGWYKVGSISKDGCITFSDSMFVSVGNGILSIDTITLNNGQIKSLPVFLRYSKDIVESNVKSLEIEISWNATVADILGNAIKELGISDESDTAYGKLIVPFPPTSDTITMLQARGLLGDDVQTIVKILSFKSRGGALQLQKENGQILIGDICYEGGTRLWIHDKSFAKAAIAVIPHPVQKESSIFVNIPEKGLCSITLISSIGQQFTIRKGMEEIGQKIIPFPIEKFPSGMYSLVLETPTDIAVFPMLIIGE